LAWQALQAAPLPLGPHSVEHLASAHWLLIKSDEALAGKRAAMQVHGHCTTPGWLTLHEPSQSATFLQVSVPLGTPPLPPQKSCAYCWKEHNDIALQLPRSLALMHAKKTLEPWQPVEQPAPNCTPQAVSVAHAMSQYCWLVMPLVDKSGTGATAMSGAADVGPALAHPMSRRNNRIR
jgi:hypothetical protein